MGSLYHARKSGRIVVTVAILWARSHSLRVRARRGRARTPRRHLRALRGTSGLGDDGRLHAGDEKQGEERCRNGLHDDTSAEA
jgi:hypothetical protein